MTFRTVARDVLPDEEIRCEFAGSDQPGPGPGFHGLPWHSVFGAPKYRLDQGFSNPLRLLTSMPLSVAEPASRSGAKDASEGEWILRLDPPDPAVGGEEQAQAQAAGAENAGEQAPVQPNLVDVFRISSLHRPGGRGVGLEV